MCRFGARIGARTRRHGAPDRYNPQKYWWSCCASIRTDIPPQNASVRSSLSQSRNAATKTSHDRVTSRYASIPTSRPTSSLPTTGAPQSQTWHGGMAYTGTRSPPTVSRHGDPAQSPRRPSQMPASSTGPDGHWAALAEDSARPQTPSVSISSSPASRCDHPTSALARQAHGSAPNEACVTPTASPRPHARSVDLLARIAAPITTRPRRSIRRCLGLLRTTGHADER